MNNYYEERNFKSNQKMKEIVATLPPFCSYFFIGIESRTSELTRLNYARDIYNFFSYLSEIKAKEIIEFTLDDLNSLTSLDLEYYLSWLTYYKKPDGKILKNNEKAKARKISSVRSLFSYLYEKNFIKENVSSKIRMPKLHEKEIIRLESDEVEKLLNQTEFPRNLTDNQIKYCKNTAKRDNAILTLLLGTGIRVSELVGLNLEDFNFVENAFNITRKGGNRVTLYFSTEVEEALKENIKWRLTLKDLPENENAMFLSLQKRRITVRAVENLVKKYSLAVIPLKNITPHKLRSTYGTNLYRETKDIYIVADVLGHKDVNTTKKHYAAISDDIRKSVVDKVKLHKK